jgi:hypothetical protein
MKVRSRLFLVLFLSLTSAPVCAQIRGLTERPANQAADAQEAHLREQQLRILHDTLFSRTLDSIKKMDEVALRVSARNQMLQYLWDSKVLSAKHLGLKRSLALDNIADINNHHLEIPKFMLAYMLSDLAALIEKHQPDLIEKLQAARETAKNGKQPGDIRRLFELKNGDALAAARIRQFLAQGDDVKELNFWLEELKKQKSRDFEPLAREVIAIAERGSQLSFETLLWLNPIYFQPEVSGSLQASFSAMILTRTQPANFIAMPAPQAAYELLNGALPYIQRILPDRYEQAMTQALVLRNAINQAQLTSEERRKRLKDSATPIEDLVDEAEAVKTNSERNELLAEAADLALRKEKFSSCLDVVAKLDLETTIPGQPAFWRNWTSQFLKKFVRNAAAAKEFELAEKGALEMTTSLAKVQAVVFMMRQWNEARNNDAARRLLLKATQIAESLSDEFDKAKGFLLLSTTCDQVDDSQRTPLFLSSIKALNGVNSPTTPRDQPPYQEYVRNLDSTGYQVVKGFRALTTKDENAAIPLINQVHTSDLRTFALIGVVSGLDDLLVEVRRIGVHR